MTNITIFDSIEQHISDYFIHIVAVLQFIHLALNGILNSRTLALPSVWVEKESKGFVS